MVPARDARLRRPPRVFFLAPLGARGRDSGPRPEKRVLRARGDPAFMKTVLRFLVPAVFAFTCRVSSVAAAAETQPAGGAKASAPVTLAEKTRGMQALPGFFPLHWDDNKGDLWLEIPR